MEVMGWSIFRSHTLGRQLFRAIFLSFLLFAFFITMIQFWQEYYYAKNQIDQRIEEQSSVLREALEASVWNYDQYQLKLIIEGVLVQPEILGVSVHDEQNRVLIREGKIAIEDQVLEKNTVISFNDDRNSFMPNMIRYSYLLHEPVINGQDRFNRIATVHFFTHPEVIWKSVSYTFLLVLLAAIVEIAVLWTIFFWVIRRKLVMPLAEITQRASEMVETSELDPDHFQPLQLQENESMELSLLKRSLNDLVDAKVTEQVCRVREARYNQELEAEVQLRTEELAQANRTKDEFLASMSHELRTPLSSIIGYTELIAQRAEDEELKELNHAVEMAGRCQLALVNDILDVSKIESGKFAIEEGPYRLEQLLDQLHSMHSSRASEVGLQFTIEQRFRQEGFLLGDAQRISQILTNLVGNAIKFTQQGRVSLTVEQADEWLIFSVEDTGIGMGSETQERLFRRFEQADGSISRRFGGSGLGLYISLNLAEMMRGTIEVESEEGKGSLLRLILPYRPTAAPTVQRQTSEQQCADIADMLVPLSGHVLVAEDTPALQLLVKKMLEGLGLEVSVVVNGAQAVAQARSTRFDLILMDMQMPGMDGIEANKVLRSEGDQTPIVALTANVMQKHRDMFREAGSNGFIAKPIDRKELGRVLQQFLHS